jgi:hypothetical protein
VAGSSASAGPSSGQVIAGSNASVVCAGSGRYGTKPERDRQDLGARPAAGSQQPREPIAAPQHDQLLVISRGDDWHDRHLFAQRELDEPFASAEHDLVAVAKRPKRVEVRARIDQHRAARRECVVRTRVARAQEPEPPGVPPQRRIVEQKIMGERIDRTRRPEPIPDRHLREEALARQQPATVISDEQHWPAWRHVLEALDAQAKVVGGEPSVDVADQEHEVGITGTHVVRDSHRPAEGAPRRKPCEAEHEPRR